MKNLASPEPSDDLFALAMGWSAAESAASWPDSQTVEPECLCSALALQGALEQSERDGLAQLRIILNLKKLKLLPTLDSPAFQTCIFSSGGHADC